MTKEKWDDQSKKNPDERERAHKKEDQARTTSFGMRSDPHFFVLEGLQTPAEPGK